MAAVLSAVVALGVIVAIVTAGRSGGFGTPPAGTVSETETAVRDPLGETGEETTGIPADTAFHFQYDIYAKDGYRYGASLTLTLTMTYTGSEPLTFEGASSDILPLFRLYHEQDDGRVYTLCEPDSTADIMEYTYQPGETRSREVTLTIPADAPEGVYRLDVYSRALPQSKRTFRLFELKDTSLLGKVKTVHLSSPGEHDITVEAHCRRATYTDPLTGTLTEREPDEPLWESYLRDDLPVLNLPRALLPTVGFTPGEDGWQKEITVYIFNPQGERIAEGELYELARLGVGRYNVVMSLAGVGPEREDGRRESVLLGIAFGLSVRDDMGYWAPECESFWYELRPDAPNGYVRGESLTVCATMIYMQIHVLFWEAPAAEIYPRIQIYCVMEDGTRYDLDGESLLGSERVEVVLQSGDRLYNELTVRIPEDAPAGTYYVQIDSVYASTHDANINPCVSEIFTLE